MEIWQNCFLVSIENIFPNDLRITLDLCTLAGYSQSYNPPALLLFSQNHLSLCPNFIPSQKQCCTCMTLHTVLMSFTIIQSIALLHSSCKTIEATARVTQSPRFATLPNFVGIYFVLIAKWLMKMLNMIFLRSRLWGIFPFWRFPSQYNPLNFHNYLRFLSISIFSFKFLSFWPLTISNRTAYQTAVLQHAHHIVVLQDINCFIKKLRRKPQARVMLQFSFLPTFLCLNYPLPSKSL